MLEYYSSGTAAPLGKSLDTALGSSSRSAVGGVDMRDELLYENILALSVFNRWIIIPAHGPSVWKDIYRLLNFSISHGLVDKGREGNGLAFRAGSSAM